MMNILPPKVLQVVIYNISDYSYWTENDNNGDPFVGFPYRWQILVNVNLQTHSDPFTVTPFYYTGDDIEIGDWISTNINGSSLQIVQILNKNQSSANLIVEDIERFNTYNDQTQSR